MTRLCRAPKNGPFDSLSPVLPPWFLVRKWYTSRLGPGSGSTPTVTSCLGRDMVVITDGALDMGLLYLDAESGEVVASTKVGVLMDPSSSSMIRSW
jgi:hypothetical protein